MNDLKDQIDLRTESVKFEIEIKKNKLMEMVNNRMKMYKFYYYQNILRKLNSEYKVRNKNLISKTSIKFCILANF